jgi:hypothetical protein
MRVSPASALRRMHAAIELQYMHHYVYTNMQYCFEC